MRSHSVETPVVSRTLNATASQTLLRMRISDHLTRIPLTITRVQKKTPGSILPGVLRSGSPEGLPYPKREKLLLLGVAFLLLLAFLLGALLRLLRLLGALGGSLGSGLVLRLGDGGNRRDEEREA